MMVMMMATTPSVKASSRPVPMLFPPPLLRGTSPLPRDYLLGQARRQAVAKAKNDNRRVGKDFCTMPGGGLRDPQGEPKRGDDETTDPTEELPHEGLAKKSPDEDVNKKPRPSRRPTRPARR